MSSSAAVKGKNQDRKDRKARNEDVISRFCRQHDIRKGKAIAHESFSKNGCSIRWNPITNHFDVKGGSGHTLQDMEKAIANMPKIPSATKDNPEPTALPKVLLALEWLINLK